MEGTQIPTYRPCSLLPVNHKATESRKEIPAAARNSPLALLILLGFLLIFILNVTMSFCVSGMIGEEMRIKQLNKMHQRALGIQ